MRKLLVALAVALALPSGAQAADYLVVYVNPTKVAPGWTLGGSIVSGDFYGSDDVFGLTLTRSTAGGRVSEKHALRSHHARSTISFDGRAGRWRTSGQLGTAAVVDMAIAASGSASPLDQTLGCTGAFRQVPVSLEGSFTLRTGTRLFKTIRRASLTGLAVSENGLVACGRPAAACEASSSLFAGGPRASLTAGPRSLTLSFSEAVRSAPANSTDWYHVLTLSGYDALTGTLPRLSVPATPSPVRGSATFAAGTTTESGTGACRVTTTAGDMTGSFSATFSGWGTRMLRLRPGGYAAFRRSGS